MRITVFTGAGMSAESGIATFRDALTGLWSRFDPAELACEAGFRNDPPLVWGWYRWRAAQLLRCRPNTGHHAIAALQDHHAVTVVTQNVDDLHERAGSVRVIHLHGHLLQSRCIGCGAQRLPDPMVDGAERLGEAGAHEAPPHCARCGDLYRPGVVWFGETLPIDAWEAAVTAMHECELLLVIGTSGVVHPAAGLPRLARDAGARIIEINPSTTSISVFADEHWACGSGEGMARLQALLKHE